MAGGADPRLPTGPDSLPVGRARRPLGWGVRLVLFAALLVGFTVVLGRAILFAAGPPEDLTAAAFRGLLVGLPAALAASWVMMSCVESGTLADLGLPLSASLRDFAAGAIIGVVLIGIVVAALAAAGWVSWSPATGGSGGRVGSLAGFLLFLGAAAFWEELIFRGYPLRVLAARFGPGAAVVATAAGFAAAHGANPGFGPVAALNTALAGILLGILYWRTLSLWLVTGAHLGWNAAMSLLADLPVSGLEVDAPGASATVTGPEILTGGAYGPEGGLALGVVVALAITWAARSRWLERRPGGASLHPLPGTRRI